VRILVTGASGFVGRAVCRYLREAGHTVVATIRQRAPDLPREVEVALVGDINATTIWSPALENVNGIVHLAALTHRAQGLDDIETYRTINVEGTAQLARAAKAAGVETFLFMSSIKVNGEYSPLDAHGQPQRLSGNDIPQPGSAYGQSKWEAEQRLEEIFRDSSIGLVILRPPLIYGLGRLRQDLTDQRAKGLDQGVVRCAAIKLVKLALHKAALAARQRGLDLVHQRRLADA
jgi:nucleoside-diphosphate-sugar epimerase